MNNEKRNAYVRKWRTNNPEYAAKHTSRMREWRKKNPEKFRATVKRAKKRLRALPIIRFKITMSNGTTYGVHSKTAKIAVNAMVKLGLIQKSEVSGVEAIGQTESIT